MIAGANRDDRFDREIGFKVVEFLRIWPVGTQMQEANIEYDGNI